MNKVFGLTDRAVFNVENMQRRVWDIENKYGEDSPEAIKATKSLLHAFMTMVRFPGTVHAEDELSLLVNSWITVGIIWHPVRLRTANGETWTDPLLGEWSTHT